MANKDLHRYSVQQALNRTFDVFTVTPTLDATGAYADADVLFNPTAITGIFGHKDDACMIRSITIIDADDQGIASEIYFTTNSTDFGTINDTANIADNTGIVGAVTMTYFDTANDIDNHRVASIKDINMVVKANGVDKDLYIASISAGTPTHTASGLNIKIGVQYI